MILEELINRLNKELCDADCSFRYVKYQEASYDTDNDEHYNSGWVTCSLEEAEKAEITISAYDYEYTKRYRIDLNDGDKIKKIYNKSINDCSEEPEE